MYQFSETDLSRCVDLLRGYGASRVWLFGSGLAVGEPVADLDLACEGLRPGNFYEAVGRLLDLMGRPVDLVDLVDLSDDSRHLTRHIKSRGRLLYDARPTA